MSATSTRSFEIEGAIHLAHAAPAEQFAELIPLAQQAPLVDGANRQACRRHRHRFDERQAQQALGAEAVELTRRGLGAAVGTGLGMAGTHSGR